jgi:cytochrome c oxidase subunit 3/cytochrome o ubiquinol oxidase subunit 3
MIGLILAEASLFGVFVVAYLFYIGKSMNGPYPKEVLAIPVLGTICLLSSSVTVALGARALARGNIRGSGAWLLVTAVLGAIFLAGTAREWNQLIYHDGLTIGTNLFGTTFYPLVGLHASHVIAGLVMLALCCVFAATGALRAVHAKRVEMVSWYWHFVDGVWVVVLTVVYLVGR